MILDATQNYIIYDGDFLPSNRADELFQNAEDVIYEFIRVHRQAPLFIEDHSERFIKSLNSTGYKIDAEPEVLKVLIDSLIEKNGVVDLNVKIFAFRQKGIEHMMILNSHIDRVTRYDMVNGVDVICYKYSRQDPNVKHYRPDFKNDVKKMMQISGAREALLTDENGVVTEASRSNLVFIKGTDFVFPRDNKALLGVTKKKLEEIIVSMRFNIIRKDVTIEEIPSYDNILLSSTATGILPVRSVADIKKFEPEKSELVKNLIGRYLALRNEYSNNYKKF